MKKINLEIAIPKDERELRELVGKTVKLVRNSYIDCERTYFGLIDNRHEFLRQCRSFNELTNRIGVTKRIESLIILEEELRFSNYGILIPRNLTNIYWPEKEGYGPRLSALRKNCTWRETPTEVTQYND